jgi:hypothetical protein
MNNWVTKIWLPILLLALAVAIYFEFGSVETFDPQVGRGGPVVNVPLERRAPPKGKQVAQKVVARGQSRLAIGERYASLEELVAGQEAAGFVRTGYFGKFWPARVAEIATDKNKISFVRQNGTRHNYSKFDGYKMKMVRLKAGANETIIVFRSRVKSR